jgi:BMFP domain-containing protein YqiC
MKEGEVIEEIKRAYAELGFVPPDVRSLSEVTLRDAENGVETAKWEVENDINGIIACAVHTLLATEREEWESVTYLLAEMRRNVEHAEKRVDYAKRCIELIRRVRSILEKSLNILDE